MIKKRLFLLFFLISLFTAVLYAQEETPPLTEPALEETAAEEPAAEEQPKKEINTPANNRIRMEIKTSNLSELAAWCRTLGLSEGGTKEELAKRLMDHFNLAEQKTKENDNVKIITIESAQATEYFTIDVIDEDYARLKGDVKLTLKDGNKEHKISADEILFNRTRNIITASGNVKYERIESGGKTETFRGRSITVNIDNWSSIFIDGNSSMEDDGSSYLFSGSVIYRSDQDVTVLSKATITSGEDDNEYWSIKSSRLWLLPGSDFAILNAILKVGEIPVLYIPFFYFPGDDVVFHPVVGYRSREGGFVQTTTYIIGQPKANSSEKSSLTRIIGNSDNNEKELQGLFLRNTSRPKKDTNSVSLKALFDYYVNLGTYTGLELTVPRTGILNQLDLNLGLGFTRTVSETSFGFSPYAPNYDGTFENNESNFFSNSVPFRYRMKFSSGISLKYGGLSWNIPYYSDPYVDRDFTGRSENMDWMNMIQQGATALEGESLEGELSPYTWQMSGNFNPSLPILSPFISNISISSISTSVSFMTITDTNQTNIYSPSRKFFAPDRYTIYSVTGSISGTPVTVGGKQSTPNNKSDSNTSDDSANDPFNGIGAPISPWTTDDTTQDKYTSTETLVPPALSQTFTMPSDGNLKFSVDYSIAPTTSSEMQFMSRGWKEELLWKTYEDVDWNKRQSILTNLSGNTNINFHIDHTSNLFSNTVTFSGNGTWREFSYLNEEKYIDPNDPEGKVDEEAMEKKRREQYNLTNYATSYAYNGTLKPFYEDPVFAQTNLQYSFRGTLVKSKKPLPDGTGPELTPQWGEWVKEDLSKDILGLNSHRVTTNLAASIMGKEQIISASAELPPLDGLINANATFRVWITETILKYSMEKKETDDEWQIKPFYFTENLRFGTVGSFSHNMTYTPHNDTTTPEEENKITYLNSSLSLWNSFTTSYTMTWIQKSVFKPDNPDSPHEGGKWEKEGDKELLPKDLRFSYSRSFPSSKYFNNRFNLSYNINTSLNFDLQEYTSSNFIFTAGVTMGITKFMELTISASSQNAVIFRYFKGVQGMEELTAMYTEGEQNNLFIDLFDSFNFFDEEKRKRSGFKMQRFNLTLNHLLGDWTATFEISMYPWQREAKPGENPTIDIVSDITFLLQWKPIMEIKSDINYDGKKDKWTKK
jgi:lipopolysaccharide assembly outer membrane protein LptD (OstA)